MLFRSRQFRNLYREAIRLPGDTSEYLIGLLERRLSTVVYRMKFAITPFATRQLINHGHIRVNGKRVNVGGYMVKPGDVIELDPDMRENTQVLASTQTTERDVPDFVQVDHKTMKGTFLSACEIVGVYAPGWDLIAVPATREGVLDLTTATAAEFSQLTTNGCSNKESAWFRPKGGRK